MKKIEKFIARCVCMGIEMYVRNHRFGFNGMLEMLPMTHSEFEKHIYKVLSSEAAKNYLEETAPTTHPQLEQ